MNLFVAYAPNLGYISNKGSYTYLLPEARVFHNKEVLKQLMKALHVKGQIKRITKNGLVDDKS